MPDAIPLGEWTAIACTVDQKTFSMYRNGVLAANSP